MHKGSILDVEVDDLKNSFQTDISDNESREQENMKMSSRMTQKMTQMMLVLI